MTGTVGTVLTDTDSMFEEIIVMKVTVMTKSTIVPVKPVVGKLIVIITEIKE